MNDTETRTDQGSGDALDKKSQKQKGNFTAVPNEIVEFLAKPPVELTTREYRVIWFMIRQLQGYYMKFKPLGIIDFVNGTGLSKQKVHPTLKLLDKKEIIKKIKLPGYRTPLYGFSEQLFGRVLATDTEKTTFNAQNGKVIDLMTFKVLKGVTKVTNSGTLKVTESGTFKVTESVIDPISKNAELQGNFGSKDSHRSGIDISSKRDSRKVDKKNWAEVRDFLREKHPGEEQTIDAVYRELQSHRRDDFGKEIGCIPALMFSSYEQMRKNRQNPYEKSSKPATRAAEEPVLQPLNVDEMSPVFREILERQRAKV